VLLELEGITKRFGGTVALAGASLGLRPGSVHALLGENGAGKTTLMRIAFGMIHPDAGTRRLRGRPFSPASPADAIAAGLGMVHQHYAIVPSLTVAEHVALVLRGRYNPRQASAVVREIGARSGLALDAEHRVGELGVAGQQRLEIVKALATGADVLILDEPTSVLTPGEARGLLAWLSHFRDSGGSVVLITHKLQEALAISDDVTILRRGRVALTGRRDDLSRDQIVTAMLGSAETGRTKPPRSRLHGEVAVVTASALEIRDARGLVRIRDASFRIMAGEIVGLAAIEGSGHRELLRAVAGRLVPTSGVLQLPDAIGFIPEDRHGEALALDMTVAENMALRGAGVRRGWMAWRSIEEDTRAALRAHAISAAGPQVPAGTLSGGNQQRLVLARELGGAPTLVVAENPARGLDLQATADLIARLRAVSEVGSAVVVHSSDLDELMALADRILVVFGGSVREVPKDPDAVGRAMIGAA
jgi:simple sugar transport system ATP-binding protein